VFDPEQKTTLSLYRFWSAWRLAPWRLAPDRTAIDWPQAQDGLRQSGRLHRCNPRSENRSKLRIESRW